MPSVTIVHAAVFAVGALVGGGVATAVTSRRRDVLPPKPVPIPALLPIQPPLVDMKAGEGTLMKAPPGATVQVDTAVLKYGHPGTSPMFECYATIFRSCSVQCLYQGPFLTCSSGGRISLRMTGRDGILPGCVSLPELRKIWHLSVTLRLRRQSI